MMSDQTLAGLELAFVLAAYLAALILLCEGVW